MVAIIFVMGCFYFIIFLIIFISLSQDNKACFTFDSRLIYLNNRLIDSQ